MTSRKNLKRLVRQRAAKTGESYSTALRHVRDQRTEKPVSTEQDHVIKCSFCSKSQKQVKKLIAGPGVYICDECIVLCNDIVGEDTQAATDEAAAVPAEPEPRETELLRRLPSFARMQTQAGKTMTSMVRELRDVKVTWEQIGAALEISAEEAKARYGTER